MDLMFNRDYSDGSLEQMVVSEQPLILLVLGKAVGHWLVSGLPLILVSPVIGLVFMGYHNDPYYDARSITHYPYSEPAGSDWCFVDGRP